MLNVSILIAILTFFFKPIKPLNPYFSRLYINPFSIKYKVFNLHLHTRNLFFFLG